jgi:hypothetical protein
MRRNKIKKQIVQDQNKESVHLGSCIKSYSPPTSIEIELAAKAISGSRKGKPGRQYSGTASLIDIDTAEFYYLTNAYVARGVDTEAAAIIRNGISIKSDNASDQKIIELITQVNDFVQIINTICRNVLLYGVQFVELYDDPEFKCIRFELLPPNEMDYLRDTSQKILYDKTTGEPQGYKQKREGVDINIWKGDEAKRIVEFKYKTLGACIEGIPGIQNLVYPAQEYGYTRGSIADSFIRSLPIGHITVDGGTEEDIGEVTAAIGQKFTARTNYVTSERFKIEAKSPSNAIDVFRFTEPTIAEIAACFHMPVEMIAATEYLKDQDFVKRYAEWIEYIKMKQQIVASILERKVFNKLGFTNPVKVRFNSPATPDTNDLIKNVGFAVQSNAITPEMALEILAKNQVFGPYTDEIIANKQLGTPAKTKEESTQSTSASPKEKSSEAV